MLVAQCRIRAIPAAADLIADLIAPVELPHCGAYDTKMGGASGLKAKPSHPRRNRPARIGEHWLTAIMPTIPIITAIDWRRYRRSVFALGLVALTGSGCSKQEAREDKAEYLSRANDYFAAEQYEKAEAEYRNVLRIDPAHPAALRQLGILYHGQGQLLRALALLKRSAELEPENVEVRLRLAQTYLSLGGLKEGREAAQAVLDRQPGNGEALVTLADTAVTPQDIEATLAVIEKLRQQDRDRPGYHLAMGQLKLRQQDQAGAETEFKLAAALEPQSSAVNFAFGNLYWNWNDLKAADAAFRKAADVAPLQSIFRMKYVDFKIQTGAVAEVTEMLENISRQAPDYLPPRVYLMKLACAERLTDDCATRANAILAQDPESFDALFVRGNLSLAAGDAAKAVREFEQLNRLYDRNPQARYRLAVAYVANGQMDAAVNSLNTALALNPQLEAATVLLAELRLKKGQYAAAVDLLTRMIDERPQLDTPYLLLANAYLAEQNRDQALEVLRRMAELFPKDPRPSYLVGTLLLQQGKQPEARTAFGKSLVASADYLPAVEGLVDLDIAEKRYADALARIQPYIDKAAKLTQPWIVRAKIYFAQRDFAHAEADLLKAIEIDPKSQAGVSSLAQLYTAWSKPEQAVETLTAFVKDNNDVPTLMQLALIQDSLKHVDAVRATYEKLLAVDPKYFPALNNLAVLESDAGRLESAYDLARRAREVVPQEPHTADTLGWIFFKKADYGNALRFLQESAAALPSDAGIQFHLGMAHYMLGRKRRPVRRCKSRLMPPPNFPDAARRAVGLPCWRSTREPRMRRPGRRSMLNCVTCRTIRWRCCGSAISCSATVPSRKPRKLMKRRSASIRNLPPRPGASPSSTAGVWSMTRKPSRWRPRRGRRTPTIPNWRRRSEFSATDAAVICNPASCCRRTPPAAAMMRNFNSTSECRTTSSSGGVKPKPR